MEREGKNRLRSALRVRAISERPVFLFFGIAKSRRAGRQVAEEAHAGRLGVVGDEACHVVVGDVYDEDQKDHQTDVDKALLEGQAEIAAAKTFKRKKKDVPAVKDGNGKNIENAEIHANERHE